MTTDIATWTIAAGATAGVITRPFGWPEAVWAVAGAALLVGFGLLPAHEALGGIAEGTDVYLFLIGMMLLAEVARQGGLFDWLAARATGLARGSATRLFALVFGVGTVVTIFLSNDATAVVLTPAVAVAAKAVKAEQPLPYLFVCALIANAASFVLPISNPANLVIYGTHLPPLLEWLPRYALPSLASIVATFVALYLVERKSLKQTIAESVPQPSLSADGRLAASGIALTAVALMAASTAGIALGLPTAACGIATMLLVLLREPSRFLGGARTILGDVSWSVLPLVAGLFVLVRALQATGAIKALADQLHALAAQSETQAAWAAGIAVAVVSNLINNLPAGLIAGHAVQAASVPERVTGAVLIGVDIGPNLSVTGSLATILWLVALRREGFQVGALQFLKVGILVMPPALLAALAVLLLT